MIGKPEAEDENLDVANQEAHAEIWHVVGETDEQVENHQVHCFVEHLNSILVFGVKGPHIADIDQHGYGCCPVEGKVQPSERFLEDDDECEEESSSYEEDGV